jgi:hypothetical protein
MDHQIENDIHIRPPLKEGMEAMGFHEKGMAHDRIQGQNGRIEPFDMADLKHPPPGLGQGHQIVRLGQGRRDRFFQQNIHIRSEAGPGDLEMGGSGNGDADGVHTFLQEVTAVPEGRAPVLIGGLLGPLLYNICHTHDTASGQPGVFLAMVGPEMAQADDPHTERIHQRRIPLSDASIKVMK